MAGVYNVDIPPSAPLANTNMDTNDGVPLGAAVTAGNPRSIAEVTSAVLETEARKRLKGAVDAAVTDDELAHSVTRTTAVVMEYAQGAYGMGVGAPAWAAPLLALVPVVTDMDARLTAMDARQRVELAQRRNFRLSTAGRDFQLHQLVKVNAGLGPPTPGQQPTANLAPAPIGTVYPNALAPTNYDDVSAMRLTDIGALAEWANDDFGIVTEDPIGLRRNKLLQRYLHE